MTRDIHPIVEPSFDMRLKVTFMKRVSLYFIFIFGMALLVIGVIPVFAYPYNDGPNSGPSNTWEILLMISNEGWVWFNIIGLALSVFSLRKIRRY